MKLIRWNTKTVIGSGDLLDIIKNNKANLSYADLSYADLRYANLSYADLSYADLRYANLSYADLSYADLSYADLRYADLRSADLRSANLRYADLRSANLSYADLSSADLRSANLSSADLSYADLRSADLRSANLRSANLSSANLSSADLRGALPQLYSLKQLPICTKLYYWKYLKDSKSPYQGFLYSEHQEYIFKAESDERMLCASGGNVATLDWCLCDSKEATEFMEVSFFVSEIAAIPYASDGKFRVSRFYTERIIDREEAIKILTGYGTVKREEV